MFGRALVVAAAVSIGSAAALEAQAPVDSLALARKYTAWLYEGAADSLVANSTERAREAFSTVEGWHQYSQQISRMAGEELAVIEETWKLRNGDCQYYRLAAFSDTDDFILVRWVLDGDGMIAAIGLSPAEQAPPFDAETCETPEPW